MKRPDYTNYELMLDALEHCLNENDERLEQIEHCFYLCLEYWNNTRKENKQRWIDFFKNVESLFLSEIEYYRLLYHAELFKPEDPEILQRFWHRESQRIKKLGRRNKEYCAYYESACSYKDDEYFIEPAVELHLRHTLTKTPELFTCPNYILFYVQMKALEKYTIYVFEQLSGLKRKYA